MIKLSKGQVTVLFATCLPMAAVGAAGAVATFVNMDNVLHRGASALGLVAAGEGATLICALIALAVTLMGQHTPAAVRLGMWLVPLIASVTGGVLAPTTTEGVVMIVTPLAMTVAGEGVAFVARRVVAFTTGTDIEQQRRAGLLLWHANRAANSSGLARRVSRSAVWRLTKQVAATDAQLAVQLGEIQRYRIAEGADANLLAALSRDPEKPSVAPAPVAPALPPAPAPQAASDAHSPSDEVIETGLPEWMQEAMAEEEARVLADPKVELLTVAQVAAMKGVAPATVRSWKARGKLRVHDTVDGSPRFHPVDVADLD